jgi:hypothetical protein
MRYAWCISFFRARVSERGGNVSIRDFGDFCGYCTVDKILDDGEFILVRLSLQFRRFHRQ